MNFVEHNLKISDIKSQNSAIYRLDQMHGDSTNPNVSTVFVTNDDMLELVELWLKNCGYGERDSWVLDRLKGLGVVVEQQQL